MELADVPKELYAESIANKIQQEYFAATNRFYSACLAEIKKSIFPCFVDCDKSFPDIYLKQVSHKLEGAGYQIENITRDKKVYRESGMNEGYYETINVQCFKISNPKITL